MICDNNEHPLNAFLPTDLTESGIVIRSSIVHPLKALLPIEVTEGGIEIRSNDVHW